MAYHVKEAYYTIQGEGRHAGRPAVFCRFTGCNLWSGRECDRSTAVCSFCDTDFLGTDGPGGGVFKSGVSLVAHLRGLWPIDSSEPPFVVMTGGEPLLQVDSGLIDAAHQARVLVAVETNGTVMPPSGIDHICVSPKAGAELKLREGHELKLVYPQVGLSPADLEDLAFGEFYLQPMDGPQIAVNTKLAIEYCRRNPRWRISVQVHKILRIP